MQFNKHSAFAGSHSDLSASKYHWLNYDDDKFDAWYIANMAARRGTELHALAHDLIRLGVKLPASSKTLNMYVNDGIGYKMKSEQMLFVTVNCFGTPDTISFRKKQLRIHDLKTGVVPASITQLEMYAAMFCLEYRFTPFDIEIELRIYQNDEKRIYEADPDTIIHIMEQIRSRDRRITELRAEAAE